MSVILDFILVFGGLCSFMACVLSGYLIRQHFLSFTNLEIQSKIVGILWMVPIYSIDSYIGLWMPEHALFIDMLRDCYEAYVLYLFLALMLSYLGCDDDETALIFYLESSDGSRNSDNVSSDNRPTKRVLRSGREFLRETKFGVLQYCVVRPFATLLAFMLELSGAYSHWGWYLAVNLALNVSVVYAFVALGSFYHRFQDKLAPFQPVPKFLCIKFVIFFAFWQGVAISLCIYYGVLRGTASYTTEMIAATLQDFLICVEMFLVAIAFQTAFSAEPFGEAGSGGMGMYAALAGDGRDNDDDRDKDTRTNIPLYKYDPPGAGSSGTGGGMIAPNNENYFDQGSQEQRGRTGSDGNGPWGATGRNGATVCDYGDDDEEAVIFGDQLRGAKEKGKEKEKKTGVLNRNFATAAAVRDFNASMPVVHVPSNFKPAPQGVSIRSDPRERL